MQEEKCPIYCLLGYKGQQSQYYEYDNDDTDDSYYQTAPTLPAVKHFLHSQPPDAPGGFK